jgi:hypothetical protein
LLTRCVVGVPDLAHIKYQFRKVVPWAYKYYILGMRPPDCPSRPEQLYKWAWEVEKQRKEREEEEEEEDEMMEQERIENEDGIGEGPERAEIERQT